MEAWHEDNISYPYALNISHVDINVTVFSSNEDLVPFDNIVINRERFGLFRMKIVPVPFRAGSTSITIEIRTKRDTAANDMSNATNVSQIVTSTTGANNSSIDQNSTTDVPLIASDDNSSSINCTNNSIALNASNCTVSGQSSHGSVPKYFNLELFKNNTHGLKFTFTLRVNETICAHKVDFFTWKIRARDFSQHVFYCAFLAHLIVTILLGAIGDYCCMRKIGLFISSASTSIALVSFIFWVLPVHYTYAGIATIMAVCSVGMGSIYYNSLFARLVQSDKVSQEKIRLLRYDSDVIPFNAFYKEKIDLMSNFSLFVAYLSGFLGLVSSLCYIILEGKNLKYVFPFHLSVHLVHPELSVMSNIVAICGLFMALLGVFIFLFSWCRCGFSIRQMPLLSNMCPPVSWSLFSLHKYWQILARWQERNLVVETGKGLLLLFLTFFCTNTFTFVWKIYVKTEFNYDQNQRFYALMFLSIVVQLSSVIWLRCARVSVNYILAFNILICLC